MIVSIGKRLRGLGEHRGDDDLSGTWQGLEDGDVTMLAYFTLDRGLGGQRVDQVFDLPFTATVLLEGGPQQRQQQDDMGSHGLLSPGSGPGSWLTQYPEDLVGPHAADAIDLEKALDLGRPYP